MILNRKCLAQHQPSSVRRSIFEIRDEREGMGEPVIYSSSGIEHETDSACLGYMVARFMDESGRGPGAGAGSGTVENLFPLTETMDANIKEDCQTAIQSQQQFEMLEGIISSSSPAELDLLAETCKSLEMAKKLQQQPERLKQAVMYRLRSLGYDAAICKSRHMDNWTSFPSGNYEYMDVILKSRNSGRSIRLIVDLDFKAQFETARPTREYSALLELLPKIYVGRDERLQSIIKIMSEGVKNSLKKKGMHLPPWRKYKYMHSMWLGSYKRTAACNSVDDGYENNMTVTESSPVTELMGMGFKAISRHVWNPIPAAGNVEVAEEYLKWGSPAAVLFVKPSTGKFIRSTLSCALMEAGLTSLPVKNSRATTSMADYASLKLIQ